jgi:hypothetical protein
MNYLTEQYPQIFARSAEYIAPVVPYLMDYKDKLPLGMDQLKLVLLALFGLTGLAKNFTPRAMDKVFPYLPLWFWPLAGGWELAACYFFYIGQFDVAIPMMYIFLGGAMYSVLSLKNIAVLPMPMATSVLVWMYTKNVANLDTSAWILPCWFLGVWAGLIFGQLKTLTDASPKEKKK